MAIQFLGAFAKLPKAIISSVMSVRLSVRTKELDSHLTDFEHFKFRLLAKICCKNPSFIKIRQEERVLYVKKFSHLRQYLVKFFLE